MEHQSHQARDGNGAQDSVASKGSTFREWLLEKAGTLMASYLTALAVLAYPAGLITVWIQLAGFYGFDYWTALRAASLPPATVVVGKTATVLFYSIFTNAVVYGWCLKVWGYKRLQRGLYNLPDNPLGLEDPDTPRDGHTITMGQYIFSMQRLVVISVSLLLPTMIFPLFFPTPWFNLGIYAAYLFLVVVGSYMTTPLIFRAGERESRPMLYKSVALAYAASVLAAVPLAGLGSPALQTAEITAQGQRQEVAVLSHSDGYWHVINSDHALIQIPDDEVQGAVKTTGTTDKPGY